MVMAGPTAAVTPLSAQSLPSARPNGEAQQPPVDTNRADQLDALIKAQPHDIKAGDLVKSAGEGIKSLFVPHHVDQTMTKDYVPTRMWWMGREISSNVSYGFAASAATSRALEMVVKAQPGSAVATIGLGLGMYWFPKVVDQFRNLTSMITSTVAPVVDRHPKAWFLAGEILDDTANAAMSCAALAPALYAPLSIGIGAAFTVAGVIKRRAQSNMFYRQAINPTKTLPEINTKESNQSIVLNLVSVGIGAGLQYAIGGTALAAGLPIIGCAAAALGIMATVRFLKHLDMENVNETVVRRAVDQMEQGKDLPEPNRHISKLLGQLFEKESIQLGSDLDRLKQSGTARYQHLVETYRDDHYLLESYKGKPHIVMKEGATSEDSVAAMVQAIHVERLSQTPEYAEILAKQGSDAADYWLVDQSLIKARQQAPGLLEGLEKKGWATDLVNFRDSDKRVTDDDLTSPLTKGHVALP